MLRYDAVDRLSSRTILALVKLSRLVLRAMMETPTKSSVARDLLRWEAGSPTEAAQPTTQLSSNDSAAQLEQCLSWLDQLPPTIKSEPLLRLRKSIVALRDVSQRGRVSRRQRDNLQQIFADWEVKQKAQGTKRPLGIGRELLIPKVLAETKRLQRLWEADTSAGQGRIPCSAIQAALACQRVIAAGPVKKDVESIKNNAHKKLNCSAPGKQMLRKKKHAHLTQADAYTLPPVKKPSCLTSMQEGLNKSAAQPAADAGA